MKFWVVGLMVWFMQGGAAHADVPMELQKVGHNTYYVQGLAALGSSENQNFISNAGFVVGKEGVVVIDALGSPALAQRLLEKIRTVTERPVTHVIVTHYHADHIYGLQHFKSLGAEIIAHRDALEYINSDTARLRLEASRVDIAPWVDEKTHVVSADRWLTGAETLKIAGLTFVVDPVGPSHTPEDLAIFAVEDQVLFAGDLIFNGRLPFVGKSDSSRWISALDTLLRHPARAVVPGHGAASMNPAKDIGLIKEYLTFLREHMGKAVADLLSFDEAYLETDWKEFESVPMFAFANRMNAYNTYLLMEQEALKAK